MGRRERLSCCGGTNVADNREIGSCHSTEFAKPKTCESWACPGRSRHRLALPSSINYFRFIDISKSRLFRTCSEMCCHRPRLAQAVEKPLTPPPPASAVQ